MAGRPDPRPPRRIVDREVVTAKLLSEPVCRMCGKPGRMTQIGERVYVAGVTAHHLIPRSQGGDDVPGNIVPLCGDGTRGCHGDITGNLKWVRVTLRSHLQQDELEYIRAKKGDEWLERRYPAKMD